MLGNLLFLYFQKRQIVFFNKDSAVFSFFLQGFRGFTEAGARGAAALLQFWHLFLEYLRVSQGIQKVGVYQLSP